MHSFRFGGGFNPTEYPTHEMAQEGGPRVRDEDQVLLCYLIRRKDRPSATNTTSAIPGSTR
jgi:hypothetical protein